MRRTGTVFVAALLAGLTLAPAAAAQPTPDPDLAVLVDGVTPDMPGLVLTAEQTSAGPRLVLRNPTPADVTVLTTTGDPLLRVGPDGVFGNIRSPEWFTSKADSIPPTAVEHGIPVWLHVSQEPAWGWFDQRLRVTAPAPPWEPRKQLGTWTVPLTQGDVRAVAVGHVEYQPSPGTFTPEVTDAHPAPGITVSAVAGRVTPTITVDDAGPGEVVVLGAAGEPYLRISPRGSEANVASPTWLAATAPAVVGATAPAEAQWRPVAAEPRATFALPVPAPVDLRPLYALAEPTEVAGWSFSMLVDGARVDVRGTTTLTPAGYVEPWWHRWVVPAIAVAGAVVLVEIVVLVVVLARRRGSAAADSAEPERAATAS